MPNDKKQTPDRLFEKVRLEQEEDWNRSVQSIQWNPIKNGWLVTKYNDVSLVLRDKRFGIEAPFLESTSSTNHSMILEKIMRHWMVFQDPPLHSRIRSVLQQSFLERYFEDKRCEIENIAQETLDNIKERKEIELFSDFAIPFPSIVISDLIGVDREDAPKILEWSVKLPQLVKEAEIETTQEIIKEIVSFFQTLINRTRKTPSLGIIDVMIKGGQKKTPLTDDEIISTLFLILVAGHETTTITIANGLFLLLKEPGKIISLRNNNEYIKPAVEEFLRVDGPVSILTRVALEDVEIDKTTVKKGDTIYASIYASGHDQKRFPEPEKLNFERTNINSHMAFGKGIHLCLGAPIARIMSQVAFTVLLKTYADISLNVTRTTWSNDENPRKKLIFPLIVQRGI
jgi:cytochrome P450 PksS